SSPSRWIVSSSRHGVVVPSCRRGCVGSWRTNATTTSTSWSLMINASADYPTTFVGATWRTCRMTDRAGVARDSNDGSGTGRQDTPFCPNRTCWLPLLGLYRGACQGARLEKLGRWATSNAVTLCSDWSGVGLRLQCHPSSSGSGDAPTRSRHLLCRASTNHG